MSVLDGITNKGTSFYAALERHLPEDTRTSVSAWERRRICSLLCRHATSYKSIQVERCNGDRREELGGYKAWEEWLAKRDRQLRSRITKLATQLKGVKGVMFSQEPRGYTVRLILENGAWNTLGGAEDGFGVEGS